MCEYTKEIALAEQKRADTIHSFKEALGKKEFQIYFHQKGSRKLPVQKYLSVGREQMETCGDSFLPILEETGEIEALDYYVYEMHFPDRREKGLNVVAVPEYLFSENPHIHRKGFFNPEI